MQTNIGNLTLSRKPGQTIRIGDDTVITIHRVEGGRVKIGIKCPKEVRIVRGELKTKEDDQ